MTDITHTTAEKDVELLSFRIGEQEYCVDIMSVREIRGWTRATPLPYSPPHVKGVINLRGKVIPLMDKDDGGRRSHYQTIHTVVPDAPAEDEIIIALGASIGGHPNHRIGDRYKDLKEMGHDVDNPAGV